MKHQTTQKLVILLTLSFFLLASSCNKEEQEGFTPTLPSITTTGENTFGCYIDGQLLTPRDKVGELFGDGIRGLRYLASDFTPEAEYNEIVILDSKSKKQGSLRIHIQNLCELGVGNYTIMESNCEQGHDANPTVNIRCSLWNESEPTNHRTYCSTDESGMLTISRYDYENKIVSGIFSFSASNKNDSSETIEITDGRFDINWGTSYDTEYP